MDAKTTGFQILNIYTFSIYLSHILFMDGKEKLFNLIIGKPNKYHFSQMIKIQVMNLTTFLCLYIIYSACRHIHF